MGRVESISHHRRLVAMVFRKNTVIDGLNFFTPENIPLQVGIHDRDKKDEVPLHYHQLKDKIEIREIDEVFFVQKGKIKVTLATRQGKTIAVKYLGAGDGMLIRDIAHKVDFVQPSRVFEVKQGPYPSQRKVYLDKK